MLVLLVFIFSSALILPLESAEPTCGYQSCPTYDPSALNVHIVPHSHDDVGWLKTFDQYYFQDVQNVLSSVITALKLNPKRRFVQVETAFFKKWWDQQNNSTKQSVIDLVNNGQFELINGAWSMNDEAAVNYQYTIDQFTLGLRYLEDNLGECARPKVGWQIDPFGHSREQASLFAQFGFDSLFFARLDYRDKINRLDTKTGDLIWRGSSNLNTSDLFTSILYQHYSAPSGFCFDIVCNDEPIIDDEDSPDYNYKSRVEAFANFIKEQASKYPTNNVIVVMGDDFRYQAALASYINTDRLIDGFDLFPQTWNGRPIKVYYSSPSCYTKAVNNFVLDNNYKLQIKSDDFFPYADGVGNLVVGYFTSRPASKRFVNDGHRLLQVAKQLAAVSHESYDNLNITMLKEAMGVLQHHDAITGTELSEVTKDYHRLLHQAIVNTNYEVNRILTKLVGDNLDLQSCLLANVSSCPPTKSDTFYLLIYNPLSQFVSSPVSIPVDYATWDVTNPDGKKVNSYTEETIIDFSQIIDEMTSPYFLNFVAEDLPPLGFKIYKCNKVEERHFRNQKVKDESSFTIGDDGLLQSVTMNGVTINITQDFLYYKSGGGSQAYVFTPADNTPQRVSTNVKTTSFHGYIQQEFNNWTRQTIKFHKYNNISYVEFDWIVGPLDISDGGKEVISRFTTSLKTNGIFYTDSNGREMLQRIRNYRPDYEYTNEQPVSGNYYPITSKIVIRDEEEDLEFAILNDRSQGGSSIEDGQVELMVHRAINPNDQFGLNEIEYGHGIVVRGKHYLVVGRKSGNGEKSLAAIQRQIAKETFLKPWVFVSNIKSPKMVQFSTLKRPLSDNVQILSLEPWTDDTLLLRLEHILEKDEDEFLSKEVTVDLNDLFVDFNVTSLQEMTLAANVRLDESERLEWPGSYNDNRRNFRDVSDFKITLRPMEIRTFLMEVEYY